MINTKFPRFYLKCERKNKTSKIYEDFYWRKRKPDIMMIVYTKTKNSKMLSMAK